MSRKRGAEKQLTKFDDVDTLVDNSQEKAGGKASDEVLAKRKLLRTKESKTPEDREAERVEQEKIKEQKKKLSWEFSGADSTSASSSSASTGFESSFGDGDVGEWGDFTTFETSDWTTDSLNPFPEEEEGAKDGAAEADGESAAKPDKLTDFTAEAAEWDMGETTNWEFQSNDNFGSEEWGDTFPSEDGKAFIESTSSSLEAPQEEPAPEEPTHEGEPDETKRWLGEVTFLHYTTNPDLEAEKPAETDEAGASSSSAASPPKPAKRWVDHGAVSFCVLTRLVDGKRASRIIVRTPGTRKLLVNLRITKSMKAGQEKTGIRITGPNSEGKTELYFVKPSSKTLQAEDLYTVLLSEVEQIE